MDRSTIVVPGQLALDRANADLARSRTSGVQVLPMAGLAERLYPDEALNAAGRHVGYVNSPL